MDSLILTQIIGSIYNLLTYDFTFLNLNFNLFDIIKFNVVIGLICLFLKKVIFGFKED